MKKGISATNLIVALAVGLIVIIGLGYLVWTWLGRGGGQIDEQFCRGKLLAYCARNSNEDVSKFFSDHEECRQHQTAISEGFKNCEDVLGFSGEKPEPTT